MSNLVDLAHRLAAAGLGKTTGLNKSIFVHRMPATVKQGVLLRQQFGGAVYQHELPGYFKETIQVVTRSVEHVAGATLSDAVVESLTMERVTVGTTVYLYMRPIHRPLVYPVSEGDYLEFSVNFDACYCVPTS